MLGSLCPSRSRGLGSGRCTRVPGLQGRAGEGLGRPVWTALSRRVRPKESRVKGQKRDGCGI